MFPFAGWLPVWSVTPWRPGLNTISFVARVFIRCLSDPRSSAAHFGNPENCLTFFQGAGIVPLLLNNLTGMPEDSLCIALHCRERESAGRRASGSTLLPPRGEWDERSG
jgi:hypothetical protein